MKLIKTHKGSLYIGNKDDVLDLINTSQTFDIIWNMANELEFLYQEQKLIAKTVLLGRCDDFDIPNKTLFNIQLNKVIIGLLSNNKVFVHCVGGHGRTGLALAAIKMKLDKLTFEQAIEFTQQTCFGPETNEQYDFLKII